MTARKLTLMLLMGFAPMGTAQAAEVTANVTLQRGHIIAPGDIEISDLGQAPKADVLQTYIGQEMQRTVYAGSRLTQSHVDRPTLVRRNERINMVYRVGRLEMTATGRALDEGGAGDIISVMNLDSKRRVDGLIREDGSVEVTK